MSGGRPHVKFYVRFVFCGVARSLPGAVLRFVLVGWATLGAVVVDPGHSCLDVAAASMRMLGVRSSFVEEEEAASTWEKS